MLHPLAQLIYSPRLSLQASQQPLPSRLTQGGALTHPGRLGRMLSLIDSIAFSCRLLSSRWKGVWDPSLTGSSPPLCRLDLVQQGPVLKLATLSHTTFMNPTHRLSRTSSPSSFFFTTALRPKSVILAMAWPRGPSVRQSKDE